MSGRPRGLGSDEDLDRQLQQQRKKAAESEAIVAAAKDRAKHQMWIATSIVGLYVVMIAVLVLAYVASPFFAGGEKISSGADKARELVNTLLIPVVTLVLGYYFGKRAD